MVKLQDDKKTKRKWYPRKSEKASVICPDCLQDIWGISEKQAKAMLKEHQKSKLCKQIATALKKDRTARKDSKPASVELKTQV